jgi:hypothetical protein
MPSAKIYRFPRRGRRRPPPPPTPEPAPYVIRRHDGTHALGYSLLLLATLVGAFLYLTGAAGIARHDALYAVLLAAVWGLYLFHPLLLRTRRLGPLLALAGKLVVLGGGGAFFGLVYWLILTHG